MSTIRDHGRVVGQCRQRNGNRYCQRGSVDEAAKLGHGLLLNGEIQSP
jgi:hypothetical protein